MATTHGIKTNSLEDYIIQSFSEFDFFQLVHILNTITNQKDKDDIKFYSQTELRCQPGEVIDLVREGSGYGIKINILGLFGPAGILPPHYNPRFHSHKDNNALHDFLNIFNQRLISIYTDAWAKSRLWLKHDENLTDNLSLKLKYLQGFIPNEKNTNEDSNLQMVLLHFSSFDIKNAKSAEGLELLLKHYFSVPVVIKPFKGKWMPLTPENYSMLPSRTNPKGQYNVLAQTFVIGHRVWHAQNRFCVSIIIKSNEKYTELFSNRDAILQMKKLIQMYLGVTYTFYFEVILHPNVIVNSRLSRNNPPELSWNCWLGSLKLQSRKFILN